MSDVAICERPKCGHPEREHLSVESAGVLRQGRACRRRRCPCTSYRTAPDLVSGRFSDALTDVEQPLPAVETGRPVADRETPRETSTVVRVARCPHCGSTIGVSTGTHHAGVWTVNTDTGECGCECSRCYVDDECVCPDCTYDHDHSRRGVREAGFDV